MDNNTNEKDTRDKAFNMLLTMCIIMNIVQLVTPYSDKASCICNIIMLTMCIFQSKLDEMCQIKENGTIVNMILLVLAALAILYVLYIGLYANHIFMFIAYSLLILLPRLLIMIAYLYDSYKSNK